MKNKVLLCSMAILMTAPLVNVKASDTYTVKSGDTLWGISNKNHISVNELLSLNKLKDNNVYVGQTLIINKTVNTPVANNKETTYTVKAGDTLWGVATKNNLSVQQLMSYNNLSASTLFVGQKLVVTKNGSSGIPSISTPNQNVSTGITQKTHTVKAGDTLWGISRNYNVNVNDIMKWNNLASTSVFVGQTIKLNASSSITSSNTPNTNSKVYAVVAASSLYLRNTASPNGSVIAEMPKGAKVEILSTSNGWNKVKYGDKTGWASISYLNLVLNESTPVTPPVTQVQPEKTAVYAVVAASSLYLRNTASPNGSVIAEMPKGAKVEILSTSNGWNKVKYGDKTGWASISYLNLVSNENIPTPSKPQETIKYAYVTATALNLRTTVNGSVVTIMPNGAKVQVVGTSGSWTKVKYNGTEGWASSEFLSEDNGGVSSSGGVNGKSVLLDPGHGGSDPGAVNGSYYEKYLTMTYANKTKQYLENMGYKVYLTRTGDESCLPVYVLSPDLQCRVNKVTTYNADVFVSIHINAAIPGAIGTETYYNANGNYDGNMNKQPAKSKKLATSIHNRYQPAMASSNRGVADSSLYVLRKNSVPATLLEIGFISDMRDLNKMTNPTYQSNVSNGIAQGINDYFKAGN